MVEIYSYLFFGLALLGLFSILQILIQDQFISKFKLHILLFLSAMTIINSIDFLIEIGFDSFKFEPFFRLMTTLLLMNVFILIGRNKISKYIFSLEIIASVIYLIIIILNSKELPIQNKIPLAKNSILKILNLITNIFFISNLIYSIIKIYRNTDTINLYQRKIKKWASLLIIFMFFSFGLIIMATLALISKKQILFSDYRTSLIILRFSSILFIIFRPRFIDEVGLPFSKGIFQKYIGSGVSKQDFEFIFFSNNYYLNHDANMDDFSLKLNHSKHEVNEYIKSLNEGNLNDLVNKNRIIYFTNLLKEKKHESLTIESLAELSGFRSRKTMYNIFHKYHGMTPTEFIHIHN